MMTRLKDRPTEGTATILAPESPYSYGYSTEMIFSRQSTFEMFVASVNWERLARFSALKKISDRIFNTVRSYTDAAWRLSDRLIIFHGATDAVETYRAPVVHHFNHLTQGSHAFCSPSIPEAELARALHCRIPSDVLRVES